MSSQPQLQFDVPGCTIQPVEPHLEQHWEEESKPSPSHSLDLSSSSPPRSSSPSHLQSLSPSRLYSLITTTQLNPIALLLPPLVPDYMHECLLFAHVPKAQHLHVLKVLAGISAMQPVVKRDCHISFKPTQDRIAAAANNPDRNPTIAGKSGATKLFPAGTTQASNDLFFLQLVGDFTVPEPTWEPERDSAGWIVWDKLPNTDEILNSNTIATGSSSEEDLWGKLGWSLQWAGFPDVPGKRPATTRPVSEIPLKPDNHHAFMRMLGYEYHFSYLLAGHRFTHGHLDIWLCRQYPLDETTTAVQGAQREIPVAKMLGLTMEACQGAEEKTDDASSSGEDALVGLQDMKPLDPSGGYLMQVSIRVIDGSKPEFMNQAFAEMTALRDLLHGIVPLQLADRMALDTRVRGGGAAAQTARGGTVVAATR